MTRDQTKGNSITFHRGAKLDWFSILVGAVGCCGMLFLLVENKLNIIWIFSLFVIVSVLSFFSSNRLFARVDYKSLTIYWGFPGSQRNFKVNFRDIESAKIVAISKKVNMGLRFFNAIGEVTEDTLQIKFKNPLPPETNLSLGLLRGSLFEEDRFWVNESNTEIWIKKPPKEGFESFLSSLEAQMV